jgi:hypothetical protein
MTNHILFAPFIQKWLKQQGKDFDLPVNVTPLFLNRFVLSWWQSLF